MADVPTNPEYAKESKAKAKSLKELAAAADSCTACPLYANATQTVFGAGKPKCRIVMVGEQPGDVEDQKGLPFVGPAGKLLVEVLVKAGVNPKDVYFTNAVKHFKWKSSGKRRIHQKPTAREVGVCKSWLEGELEFLRPEFLVCLGVTAAQAVIGKVVTLKEYRGKLFSTPYCSKTLVTTHPSALLRAPDSETRAEMIALMLKDLKTINL